MGIHTGEAEVRDGDYCGSAVNRAERLMSVAHGGQIVVSAATEELLHDALPEKYGFVDLGEHRLRDLARPERVFQVTASGSAAGVPAVAVAGRVPGEPAGAADVVRGPRGGAGRDREARWTSGAWSP